MEGGFRCKRWAVYVVMLDGMDVFNECRSYAGGIAEADEVDCVIDDIGRVGR